MNSRSKPHFVTLIKRWQRLQLPLRPRAPVPERVAGHLPKGRDRRVLMLGVTPDLADISDDMTALDWSEDMIAHVWPGDTERRRAIAGDWRDMPFDADSFDAVICDNAMSLLAFPRDLDTALAEVRRVLRPGGRTVFRWFLAPETAPTDEELLGFIRSADGDSVDALRWRFAIDAVHAAETPNVSVRDAFAKYARLVPDLDALARDKGWDEEERARLVLYRDSDMVVAFPSRAEMESVATRHFGRIDYAPSGDYPLSEFAPLVLLS